MENMTLKEVVVKSLQDIFNDVKWANHLVEEGKEVPADRKLQGVRAKMLRIMKIVHEQMPEEVSYKEEEPLTENVAQETPKEQ